MSDQISSVLRRHRVMGMAQGLLMARHSLNWQDAEHVLVLAATRKNVTVVTVAEFVVAHGDVYPDADPPNG